MFQILSDGSCDLTAEQLQGAGLEIIPYYVSFDGNTYLKEGVELNVHNFYEYCVAHPDVYPKTSMPSVQDYIDAFERHLERGEDILCYCLSEKFSGSFSCAKTAAGIISENYPERQIRVVDSTFVTGLQGLLLLELSRYAKEGHSLEETYKCGEEIKKTSSIYFTIANFAYLLHGGRIGKLMESALTGMNMRPVIRFSSGELYPVGLCMSREKAFAKIVQTMEKAIKDYNLNLENYTFAIGWGYSKEEGEPLFRQIRDLFLEKFGKLPEFIQIQIGATIGVHTGPHTIGTGFIKKA